MRFMDVIFVPFGGNFSKLPVCQPNVIGVHKHWSHHPTEFDPNLSVRMTLIVQYKYFSLKVNLSSIKRLQKNQPSTNFDSFRSSISSVSLSPSREVISSEIKNRTTVGLNFFSSVSKTLSQMLDSVVSSKSNSSSQVSHQNICNTSNKCLEQTYFIAANVLSP